MFNFLCPYLYTSITRVGFMKKSVSATIVTAILLAAILDNVLGILGLAQRVLTFGLVNIHNLRCLSSRKISMVKKMCQTIGVYGPTAQSPDDGSRPLAPSVSDNHGYRLSGYARKDRYGVFFHLQMDVNHSCSFFQK